MPAPSSPTAPARPSILLALLCASVVAAYDRDWLARPVARLIPKDGPRPERLSRLKALLLPRLEALLTVVTKRGRPRVARPSADTARAAVLAGLLGVVTEVLATSHVPWRRRELQDRVVAAFDRLHQEHALTQTELCAALALPVRTFRAWHARPARPLLPGAPPPAPPPRRRDRATGRFALEVTAPDTQLGADTTDVRLLGVDLKLTAAQDLGAREQRLWDGFALATHETAALVTEVVTAATADRAGLQLVTDQGTPFLAHAARAAYDALGLEHVPQREGTPTEKATVERSFATVKQALAPLLALTNQLADAVPALRQPELATKLGQLLFAVFLRVYLAGRRHLQHPLAASDPDAVRAIIAAQREQAHAEQRSTRLFLEALHAEYAFPGSREVFVRTFRRYPLADLQEAERRLRPHACRCQVRCPDRYFAAILRDVHEQAHRRRSAAHARALAAAAARRRAADQAARDTWLDEHPELRLHHALDLLADTWQPERQSFLLDGAFARLFLRVAAHDLAAREPGTVHDDLERHWRTWLATRPTLPAPVRTAVRTFFTTVVTATIGVPQAPSAPAALAAILAPAARAAPDNLRPPHTPDLRN